MFMVRQFSSFCSGVASPSVRSAPCRRHTRGYSTHNTQDITSAYSQEISTQKPRPQTGANQQTSETCTQHAMSLSLLLAHAIVPQQFTIDSACSVRLSTSHNSGLVHMRRVICRDQDKSAKQHIPDTPQRIVWRHDGKSTGVFAMNVDELVMNCIVLNFTRMCFPVQGKGNGNSSNLNVDDISKNFIFWHSGAVKDDLEEAKFCEN